MSTKKNEVLHLSSVDIALELLEVPKPNYNRGKRWVQLGPQHSFMGRVLTLLRKSPTASALMNRKTALVAGDGFKVDAVAAPELAQVLKNVARTGRYKTGDKLFKRLAKDYVRLRGYAVQVIWATDRLHIAELHHQRFETVASGPMNDEGEVETYFICRDWSKTGTYPPKEIPAYNPGRADAEPVQLYYYFEEEPGVEYYPALDYESALPYIEMEADLAAYHGSNVASNFAAQTIVAINKGPEDTQDDNGNVITAASQRTKFEDAFEKKYTGPKARRILYLYGDGTADAAEKLAKITTIGAGNADIYNAYAALAQQAILSAGSCTSPMVAGLPSTGGDLGGNGSELYESFKLFFNAACRPDQETILDGLKELLGKFAGVSFDGEPQDARWLDVATTLPVEYTFSEATMELIMTDDELRDKIGLKPLPAGAQTAAQPTGSDTAAPPAKLAQLESVLLMLSKNEKLLDVVLDNKSLQVALFGSEL